MEIKWSRPILVVSAPVSGNKVSVLVPLLWVILTTTDGDVSGGMLTSIRRTLAAPFPLEGCTGGVLRPVSVALGVEGFVERQYQSKWPRLPHLRHVELRAGHRGVLTRCPFLLQLLHTVSAALH